jgi:hypothetical protein
MSSHFRVVIGSIVSIAILMILILGIHLGGPDLLRIGIYSPLLGAFIGGTLALVSINIKLDGEKNKEPWLGYEKLAWNLIGCGCIAWGIGECFWRYYVSQGQTPFPSLADLGYSSLSPLVFVGLILQPFSRRGRRRVFLVLDSLIATGALLSIAWFLLLGPLAQTPTESVFTKFLALYYPTSDVALVSCTIFLLLRGADQAYTTPAHRISLLVLGIGLSIYAISDFLFNIMLNLGVSVDGSWIDLGWPLGIMTAGVAAYLRRFLPSRATENHTQNSGELHIRQSSTTLSQFVPYFMLCILFIVLAINVLSTDKTQQNIRPVLIIATFIVIGLLVARQVVTIRENERLLLRTQKIAELEAIEIKRQEEQLAISKQIEEGIQQIITTMGTVVTRSDFSIRVPMSQENILWRVGRSINNLLSRLQGFKQSQEELKKTHAIAAQVAQHIRDGKPIQLASWTGTVLDPVIIEYNKRFQNPPGHLTKSRLVPGSTKP